MYLLKLTFLALLLVGSFGETNASESGGDERFSWPTAPVHVKEDADTPKQESSPSEQCRLVQRLAKRKLGASVFSFATYNGPPSINGRSFGYLDRSCTGGEDDCIALYRSLRVYRC